MAEEKMGLLDKVSSWWNNIFNFITDDIGENGKTLLDEMKENWEILKKHEGGIFNFLLGLPERIKALGALLVRGGRSIVPILKGIRGKEVPKPIITDIKIDGKTGVISSFTIEKDGWDKPVTIVYEGAVEEGNIGESVSPHPAGYFVLNENGKVCDDNDGHFNQWDIKSVVKIARENALNISTPGNQYATLLKEEGVLDQSKYKGNITIENGLQRQEDSTQNNEQKNDSQENDEPGGDALEDFAANVLIKEGAIEYIINGKHQTAQGIDGPISINQKSYTFSEITKALYQMVSGKKR